MSKKISVIIPVYNSGDCAVRVMDELLALRNDLEIVCVNDGSTDDSKKILTSYAKKHAQVVLFSKENGGAATARNYGLDKATGDLICFVDSDDDVLDDFFELADGFEDQKVDLSCGALEYFRVDTGEKKVVFDNEPDARGENETLLDYALRIMAHDGRFNGTIPKMFRREIIEKFSIRFQDDFLIGEDTCFLFDYFVAMSKLKRSEIRFVPKALYRYNYKNSGSLASENTLSWANWQKIVDYIAAKLEAGRDVDLLRKVERRWRIGCLLSVARSGKSFKEKCRFANPVKLLFAQIIVKFRK